MNGDDDDNLVDDRGDHDLKHDQAESPSVKGEENVFSGDATSSESPDIDIELEKVGLKGDNEEGIKPLRVASELEEEAE